MPNYSDETIADALDGVQRRRYVLPAIQREFVWGTDRICALFDSLMRIGKSERLPLEWAHEKYRDPHALAGYLAQNDMAELPVGLDGFLDFYDRRRERLRERLVAVLGRSQDP